MRLLRLASLAMLMLGIVAHWRETEEPPEIVPFPGAGLSVQLSTRVDEEGDYRVQVDVTRVGDSLAPADVTIPCALTVRVGTYGGSAQTKEVTALSFSGETGFSRVQHFKSAETWHLEPGRYVVEVLAKQSSPVAMARGAALSFVRASLHPTEQFLWARARHFLGFVLLFSALAGFILAELFARPPS